MELLNVLTEEDKYKISNFVKRFGKSNGNFIGCEEWLKYWSKEKVTLYHLLGDQLIRKIPFSYEKTHEEKKEEFRELGDKHPFILEDWNNFIINLNDYLPNLQIYKDNEFCKDQFSIRIRMQDVVYIGGLATDKIYIKNTKIKYVPTGKTLQLQSGMKPIRAIGKVIKFFNDIASFEQKEKVDLFPNFESYRIAHSMVLNDKVSNSNLVLSIHPLDFLTMSDNDSGWSSCMSWEDDGCYHTGTIEMMNSNLVLCTYLESSSKNYIFYSVEKNKPEEKIEWNNKKWRQLFYVNNKIAVGGKAYPRQDENLTKGVLEAIVGFAQENMNWTYQYGPELYNDMKHVRGMRAMKKQRQWLKEEPTRKKTIIFDSNAMYNDMLNDQNTQYWCYRNKVGKRMILNYSGKANCIVCGRTNIIGTEDTCGYYNERFITDHTVCDTCYDNIHCAYCKGSEEPSTEIYTLVGKTGTTLKVCKEHLQEHYKVCPCCNKSFMYLPLIEDELLCATIKETTLKEKQPTIGLLKSAYSFSRSWSQRNFSFEDGIAGGWDYIPIYLCSNCIATKFSIQRVEIDMKSESAFCWWWGQKYLYAITDVLPIEQVKEYSSVAEMEDINPLDSSVPIQISSIYIGEDV